MGKDDKLLREIDRALAPEARDVLTGLWCRQRLPQVKHWVHAGREPNGEVRLVGGKAALDIRDFVRAGYVGK